MQFDVAVILDNWQPLAVGFARTIGICTVSLPIGFILGVALALLRLHGGLVFATVAAAYVELLRNIPFLTQVFLLYFVLPEFGLRLSPLVVGFIALSAYASAYAAEIVRGAILSVPAGQTEAGYALGLGYATILRRILLPQVLGYILPTSTNLAIGLIKESAVLSVITVPELTYEAQDIIGRTFSPVEIFTIIALLYWGLTALVSTLTKWLEIHLQPYLTARRTG
ncbi:amino acid ABC transporter permease [Mesorhizobium caraganae]|uniref:amino acid ABC transporter permease n=1 Tax=Mesorhizobium caraganae TaxID=483206 RepID=UPI001781C53E|nr:amino acid ABC transporter permease [Mesorhizobium caraganae]